MKRARAKSKIKIVALIVVACIIATLTINGSNKTKTSNVVTTEYHASVSDSKYSTVDEGFNFTMVGQGSGLNCYAYSSTKAMEARLFKLGYGIVNFSEPHMTDFIKGLGRNYEGAITWDDVWLAYLEPKDENGSAINGPYEEGAYSISYKATSCTLIDSNIDSIKAAVLEYGGLDASVKWSGNSYKGWNNGQEVMATPSGTYEVSNHGITILGWDDTFNNFPSSWGVKNPGAFLTYNPAGNNCAGNYLWVSYEDQFILDSCYAYDMAENSAPAQHDPVYNFSTDGLTINDIPFGGDISFTFTGGSFDDHLLVTAFFNTEGVQLHEGTDFYVECSPNAAVGTFQMFIKGMGAYEGQQLQQPVNITPKDIVTIDKIEITKVNDDGTVNVEAVYGNLNLVNGTDYDIEYKDSATAGKKVATIRGKGNYNGWAEREFSVNTTPDPGTNPDPGTDPDPNPPATGKLAVTINTYGTKEVGGTKYINKITEKQTITNLENNVKSNGTIEIYDGANKVSDKNTKIKTGMKLVAKKDSETAEYILVVNGDVNGDGIINGIDLMKVSRYVSGADKNLTGANLVAANVSDTTKDTIDDKDSSRISRYMISLESNLN